MKLSILVIILFCSGVFNQLFGQWVIKHIDESYSEYNAIKFKNESLGLCMGLQSEILKSEDAGETWRKIPLDIEIGIRDFQFSERSTIFAIGDGTNKLIKSEDSGETWLPIAEFPDQQLRTLHFYNNDSGIVAGYDGIYRSVNGAITWDKVWDVVEFGYRFGVIMKIHFPSKTGYAIGTGKNQHNDPNFDNFLLKSYDAGLTWDSIKTFPYSLETIYFLNEDTGFIGTGDGVILKTTDGGENWNETQIATNKLIKSIHFPSNLTGFAIGGSDAVLLSGYAPSIFISKTMDGGVTWETYDTTALSINSIHYVNDSIGFVCGTNLIMKSGEHINVLPENYPWHLVPDPNAVDKSHFYIAQIKIYPNPANGIIYIQPSFLTQDIKSINLISTEGTVTGIAKQPSFNDIIPVDISNIAPGMYLIQIVYSDRIEQVKFLKRQ